MRPRFSNYLVLGALVVAPAGLAAQEICGGSITAPPVGNYAEYRLVQKDGGTQQVRFAIVGTEIREGTRNVWFENRVQAAGKPTALSQVLVPSFPYDPSAVAAATLQVAASPPLKLNASQLSRLRGGLPGLLQSVVFACRSGTLVGTETIKAAGKSVRAQHYRNALRGSDIWVSSKVPFGVVKLVDGTDHTSMELTDTGTDAKSSLSAAARSPGQGGS